MRAPWVLVAAFAALAARADEPVSAADPRLYAEPSVDPRPTPYACTLETLASGADCVFESVAPAAADPARQALENAAAAGKLGGRLCPGAARHPLEPIPDPGVLSWCKRAFGDRSVACGVDGTRALLDADGRFAGELRLCYAALSEVLSRARTMAISSAPCCRCLAARRCLESAERCNAEALSHALGGAAATCAADRCAEACAARIPEAPRPASPASPASQGSAATPATGNRRAPSPCFDPLRLEVPCASY